MLHGGRREAAWGNNRLWRVLSWASESHGQELEGDNKIRVVLWVELRAACLNFSVAWTWRSYSRGLYRGAAPRTPSKPEPKGRQSLTPRQ